MSPSLRWWPSWWWPLVHLRSFRCRLLDGSHYTRLTNVRQIESTQTTPKPLQTLAFIGVSQPHDGDTKTSDATAMATTSRARHGGCDAQDAAATATTDATQPGRHDMTTTHRRTRHHGHTHDGHARPCTTATATARPRSCTATSHMQLRKQRNAPARYHTTRNASTEQTFERTDVR